MWMSYPGIESVDWEMVGTTKFVADDADVTKPSLHEDRVTSSSLL